MVKLDQKPGEYYLRFAATPLGDMQQIVEDSAVVQYERGVHESSMTAMESSRRPSGNQTLSILDEDTTGIDMLLNGSAKTTASTLRSQNLAHFDRIGPNATPTSQRASTSAKVESYYGLSIDTFILSPRDRVGDARWS